MSGDVRRGLCGRLVGQETVGDACLRGAPWLCCLIDVVMRNCVGMVLKGVALKGALARGGSRKEFVHVTPYLTRVDLLPVFLSWLYRNG